MGGPPFAARPARVFTVGARSGLKGQGWPGGRFYIGPDGLRVTTAGRLAGIDVSVPKYAVTGVWVGRGFYGKTIRVTDTAGLMAHVSIQAPFGRKKIVAELRRCGYQVTGS